VLLVLFRRYEELDSSEASTSKGNFMFGCAQTHDTHTMTNNSELNTMTFSVRQLTTQREEFKIYLDTRGDHIDLSKRSKKDRSSKIPPDTCNSPLAIAITGLVSWAIILFHVVVVTVIEISEMNEHWIFE
jgi:hypothetical protein